MEARASMRQQIGSKRFRIEHFSQFCLCLDGSVSLGNIFVRGMLLRVRAESLVPYQTTAVQLAFEVHCTLPRSCGGRAVKVDLFLDSPNPKMGVCSFTPIPPLRLKDGSTAMRKQVLEVEDLVHHMQKEDLVFDVSFAWFGNAGSRQKGLDLVPAVVDDSLPSSLKVALEEGSYSDITIRVGGEELKAHAFMLCARSPVFERMLSANMSEAATGVIKIKDVDAATLRRLLQFVYTGTVEDKGLWADVESSMKLLQAAAKYDVPALARLCASQAADRITADNVSDWLALASVIGEPTKILKYQCMMFIAGNLVHVQDTAGWKRLDDATLVKELFSFVCDFTQPRSKK